MLLLAPARPGGHCKGHHPQADLLKGSQTCVSVPAVLKVVWVQNHFWGGAGGVVSLFQERRCQAKGNPQFFLVFLLPSSLWPVPPLQ